MWCIVYGYVYTMQLLGGGVGGGGGLTEHNGFESLGLGQLSFSLQLILKTSSGHTL